MKSYDAIVIGIGGMGGAVAAELAHVVGVSWGWSSLRWGTKREVRTGKRASFARRITSIPLMFRCCSSGMALAGIGAGERPAAFQGMRLLDIGIETGELISGVSQSAAEHGLAVEQLRPAELRKRFPPFVSATTIVGFLSGKQGFARARWWTGRPGAGCGARPRPSRSSASGWIEVMDGGLSAYDVATEVLDGLKQGGRVLTTWGTELERREGGRAASRGGGGRPGARRPRRLPLRTDAEFSLGVGPGGRAPV